MSYLLEMANRIIFVPGKNPKPAPENHRRLLLRCLLRGVEQADPSVAQAIEKESDTFMLMAWNRLYYRSYKPVEEDRPWIEALLKQSGPAKEDVRKAVSIRQRFAWLLYTLADLFNFLIPLLPDPAVKSTIQETVRYFSNEGGIGEQVREILKVPLRQMFANGERILLIGHSMGSVIAYDALWEMSHFEKISGFIDLFLTLGSPLGMKFTQERLRGAKATGSKRYPHNIRHWVNLASQGDLTALDPILRDDYREMLDLGLVTSITDIHEGIFNYFRNDLGLNVHRSYGYLVNPRVGEVIANWWKKNG